MRLRALPCTPDARRTSRLGVPSPRLGRIAAIHAGGSASPSSIRMLSQTLNDADAIKIAFIALTIGTTAIVARRSAALAHHDEPRLRPMLALSGLAFPPNSDTLYGVVDLTSPFS